MMTELIEMIKKSEKTDLSFNDNYVVCANDVIMGKQAMSLQVARLIRLVVMQVAKDDKDLRTYTCKVQDLADFLHVTSQSIYKDIQKICEETMKSIVYTKIDSKNWEIIHWVSYAGYKDGVLTIRLSDELKEYVLELNKFFTRYKLSNILEFNSFYAIRLYELLMCRRGLEQYTNEFEFTLKELREQFGCEKKYKLNVDFLRYTVDVAVKEINASSDIMLEKEFIKESRQITAIKFTMTKKPAELPILPPSPLEEEPGQDIISQLRTAVEYEFDSDCMNVVYDFVKTYVHEKAIVSYVQGKHSLLKYYAKKNSIVNRFDYFLKMLQSDAERAMREQSEHEQLKLDGYQATYDISEYESYSVINE